MGQNHIGAVSVPALKSALPRSADFTFIADGRDKWGLGFLITADQVPGKRSPGSLSWGGINNTFFWIDPARGIAGVIMMQYLPFADAKALAVLRRVRARRLSARQRRAVEILQMSGRFMRPDVRKWSRLAPASRRALPIFAFNPGLQLLVKKVAEKFDDILASGVGHLGIIGDRGRHVRYRVVEGGGLPVSLLIITPCGFSSKRHLRQVGALSDWMALSETGSLPEIKPRPRLRFLHSGHCRMGSSRPKVATS
jgi:hypothetical protein